MHFMQIGLVFVCLLGLLSAKKMIHHYSEQAKNALVNQASLMFVATSQKDEIYLDKITQPFSKEQLQTLKQLDNVHIYPVGNVMMMDEITQKQIAVLPYYSTDYFINKKETQYFLNDRQGVYISKQFYDQFDDYYTNLNETKFHLFSTNGKTISAKQDTMCIQGVLKQDQEHFHSDSDLYVYVYHENYEKVLDKDELILGYVVQANTLKEYEQALHFISESNMGINDTLFDYGEIKSILLVIDTLQWGSIGILCILMLVLWNILFSNYFEKRKKEFAILKINGLDSKMILNMCGIDFLIKTIASVLLTAICYVVIWKEMFSIFTLCIILLALAIFQFIMTQYSIKRIHSDQILRN